MAGGPTAGRGGGQGGVGVPLAQVEGKMRKPLKMLSTSGPW